VPDSAGVVDLVLIGLKTTANGEFPRLVPGWVGPQTAVLTLQNGLGNEDALARLVPPEQVLGGLCLVSLNRTAPGRIRHIDLGTILLGEHGGLPTERTHSLAAVLESAGIPCEVCPDLLQARWRKLVWNIPFNGLGVAGSAGLDSVSCGRWQTGKPLGRALTAKDVLETPAWRAIARDLMGETIAVATALGHPIDPAHADAELVRTVSMGPYRPSTVVDFEMARPMELDAIFYEPQREAHRAGVPTPRLDALCGVLRSLEAAGVRPSM
jgi:2-dehydropantoate 2-reductase